MICPNCGASNSNKATFCRRCHQRMPVAGLAAGVTYPRRRVASSGTNKLPIIAALALAITGLVVGAFLVSIVRPGGGTAVASPTGSPISSLPIYVPITPTPTAEPTPPPLLSFPALPTPGSPSPSVGPTDSGFVTPPPSVLPTPTPTQGQPTPTPTRKPTPPPTATPTATPTPTPTGTPIALTCTNATGTPTDHQTIGYGNKTSKKSLGWCLDYVIFHVVTTTPPGSTYGDSRLLLNGKTIAPFSCAQSDPPTPCQNDVTVQLNQKLAKVDAIVAYDFTCVGDSADPAATCANPGYNATATFYFELATTP